MMRSLWTGASGMTAQQLQVDTIANNLANVNTHGFKRETQLFSTLLYDTIARAEMDPANPPGRSVNLQVGMGVRPVATGRDFRQGALEMTERTLDMAINGNAFFNVRMSHAEDPIQVIGYTRNGSFVVSPIADDEMILSNRQGFTILDIDGEPIVLPIRLESQIRGIDNDGVIWLMIDDELVEHDQEIALTIFPNPQGLEAVGNNLFVVTQGSGDPIIEQEEDDLPSRSSIITGTLEMSNVNVANEMVSLIVSQRAFEMNARSITTSDQMLQEAVNLRR